MSDPLRFGLLGAGFWAPFQLAAWGELPGARCVAICDRDREKAERLAARFGVEEVFEDAGALFRRGRLDFVDVVTGLDAHRPLVLLAAEHRLPVICQKVMAPTL